MTKHIKKEKVTKVSNSVFTLVEQGNGIAHIVMDVKGDSMNTLKAEFSEDMATLLAEIKANSRIKGLVLISGKADSFVAGADVNMIAGCKSNDEATALSRKAQMMFCKLENLELPLVAAINGACLGGGLELAMACHARVCTDNDKTSLGLPEVQLGLLPGGGGTQRLPLLVGLQKSLDMMLTGKVLRAKQALKAGLVDEVVSSTILISAAEKLALSIVNKTKLAPVFKARKKKQATWYQNPIYYVLEKTIAGRNLVFSKAKKTVLAKTHGNYPAPLKIIDCIYTGIELSSAQGYQIEADHFGDLVMSPESAQLRRLFFATTEMKGEQGVANVMPNSINHIAVLGGGLMGGGIAFISATKAKSSVRIKDISHQGISSALNYSYRLLIKKVKRRFMSHHEMQSQLSLITGTTDYSGFKKIDLVIEAVFEDLALKQQMVNDIEQNTSTDTIFASNTSSLPINKIAEKAQRPENVIGLHYFSPVDKMPLAEIIAHDKTSEQTISTTVAYAKKQGKTPIVVKDKAGFYVNRILAPYINEAAILLLAGESIDKIDKALTNFGFPIGPMQLLDEVGIDIGAKIGPILQAELGERFAPPKAFERLISDGRLGKKVGKGFYLYGNKQNIFTRIIAPVFARFNKKKRVDQSIYSLLSITPSGNLPENDIVKRCTYMMLNEAVRCLDEGIIRSKRDGDIGAIFGIGFPPFLGGPFSYLAILGPRVVVEQLNLWTKQYGERFIPCEALIKMAEETL